jgi:hypothetical protein
MAGLSKGQKRNLAFICLLATALAGFISFGGLSALDSGVRDYLLVALIALAFFLFLGLLDDPMSQIGDPLRRLVFITMFGSIMEVSNLIPLIKGGRPFNPLVIPFYLAGALVGVALEKWIRSKPASRAALEPE